MAAGLVLSREGIAAQDHRRGCPGARGTFGKFGKIEVPQRWSCHAHMKQFSLVLRLITPIDNPFFGALLEVPFPL